MSFLKRLRELNVERCEAHYFSLDAWSVLEWAGAAAGEMGEAANVAKKMRRMQTLQEYDTEKYVKLHAQLGEEIADTIIYLDLLCAQQGINLEEVIAQKFNERSKKYGFDKTL